MRSLRTSKETQNTRKSAKNSLKAVSLLTAEHKAPTTSNRMSSLQCKDGTSVLANYSLIFFRDIRFFFTFNKFWVKKETLFPCFLSVQHMWGIVRKDYSFFVPFKHCMFKLVGHLFHDYA